MLCPLGLSSDTNFQETSVPVGGDVQADGLHRHSILPVLKMCMLGQFPRVVDRNVCLMHPVAPAHVTVHVVGLQQILGSFPFLPRVT